MVGLIVPRKKEVTGEALVPGDAIIGVTSSGLHSNGITLLIERVMKLPKKFMTRLLNGYTLGEEALIPTRSYVGLVDWILSRHVEVHKYLPGTGGGVAKLAADPRPFQYRIIHWPGNIPPIFTFLHETCKIPLSDCLTTFNWGIGFYVMVPTHEISRVLSIASMAGYEAYMLGYVEKAGPLGRRVIMEPFHNLYLQPPDE